MSNSDSDNIKKQLEDKTYFLNEIASFTNTGSYSGNKLTGEAYMDSIARAILMLPYDFKLTLKNSLQFHKDKKKAIELFMKCVNNSCFEEEIEMIRFDGSSIWVKAAGSPYVADCGKTVGFRGVFTSIDLWKKNTISAQKNAKVIGAQNERLVHFAHIVSHNLRTYSSNLQLSIDTFNELYDREDIDLFKSYLKDISTGLNTALLHLNKVMVMHTQNQTIKPVDFKAVFEMVFKKYKAQLEKLQAKLSFDFSELHTIDYVPTFLSNLFDNLMSNAISYRSPDRVLEINIYTEVKDGNRYLLFADNGLGIDLEKNRDKIFQMYRTFHQRKDALGVGLFLIKHQVESLDGEISVQSTVDQGTTFIVRF